MIINLDNVFTTGWSCDRGLISAFHRLEKRSKSGQTTLTYKYECGCRWNEGEYSELLMKRFGLHHLIVKRILKNRTRAANGNDNISESKHFSRRFNASLFASLNDLTCWNFSVHFSWILLFFETTRINAAPNVQFSQGLSRFCTSKLS